MQPEVEAAAPVEREESAVMFLRVADELPEMQRAWPRLEQLVGMKGRKFYGAFHPSTHEYWVCTEVKDEDEPEALGLETGTLPGGRYLRARLRGEPPAVYERIASIFGELVQRGEHDGTRPSIEFYRSFGEIDLLLPLAS
jgi:integron-associated effector binding protein